MPLFLASAFVGAALCLYLLWPQKPLSRTDLSSDLCGSNQQAQENNVAMQAQLPERLRQEVVAVRQQQLLDAEQAGGRRS